MNCARQVSREEVNYNNFKERIPRWQNSFSRKYGNGEIIISTPDFRTSSYFSFEYNTETRTLSGKLLGSFGMVIGEFYSSTDSFYILDKDGKKIDDESSLPLDARTLVNLRNLLVWDFDLPPLANVIKINGDYLISGSKYEYMIRKDYLPFKITGKNREITALYKKFRNVNGFMQPFVVDAKKKNKRAQIEYKEINLE